MRGFTNLLNLLGDLVRDLRQGSLHGVAVFFLAFVFAWSGIVKIRSPKLAALAMADFGVIRTVKRGFGTTLGVVELSEGLLLAASVLFALALLSLVAALEAALLLTLFAALIGRSLILGDRFPCFCFGDRDSTLSILSFVRALFLAAVAAVLATAPIGRADRSAIVTLALQAEIAAAVLGMIALGSRFRRLLRWNRDPFVINRRAVI